jgi:hypothetical protein
MTINPKTTRYRRKRMADGRYLTMQRAMMEEHLGRRLPPDEIVHHKNEDKIDNRIENFEVMTRVEHGLLHNPPINPVTSICVVCQETFTPHKTKRGRKQTCSPACKTTLLKTRWREHHPRRSAGGKQECAQNS